MTNSLSDSVYTSVVGSRNLPKCRTAMTADGQKVLIVVEKMFSCMAVDVSVVT